MATFEAYIHRMNRLQYELKKKRTGNADELAARLNISRRTLFKDIEYLRDRGADIKYCRFRKTFYFREEFELKF